MRGDIQNRRILLVEDNPNDADLALRALRKNNIQNETIIARDGVEALEYLFCEGRYACRGTPKLPDLVLLDLKLPKVDGIEVLRRIRSDPRTKRLPVIMLTSSMDDGDVLACYDSGANSYVRKPVDFVEFTEAVRQLGGYWLGLNVGPPELWRAP